MKKFGLILAGCVAFIGFCGAAYSDDIGDVARVANRRVPAMTSVSGSRGQNNTDNTSRLNSTTSHTTQNVRGRNTTTTRTPVTTERTTTTTRNNTTGNVVSRTTAANVATRTGTQQSRSATRTASSGNASSRAISRATTVTREDILNRDYSKCKKVFFDCMDEFCANKDAQLKRCACSSRINEFDSVKKQLAAAEDKMLDFNQKLLTVSMEKEDAAALNIATEGETAFLSTKDNTKSKQTLNAIAKKLNASFDSSNFDDNNLQVLSWSLDIDSAFDNVDSLMGASTTSKSGTALYSAALPVCRQMAAEVCSDSDVSLAEGGYQALIEQDCNTVAKTYKNQAAQARSKVKEGSALLDMSRLDVYQQRNSDDILTCKKKMLDMLTDSTVCGDELGKCLDITGQYINPTTGEVFLTPQLVNLTTLLSRPDANSTWSTTAKNDTFVTFLNSKKKFLQPAMEHCQKIADSVWDSFIEDALAQIKLAQDKKLDSVRQSCTVLTAQCLADASETITKFDSRALSTFGIAADKTANVMCADVINSCTALLNLTNDGEQWNAGVSEINRITTYETLMHTCREVGRACIIQVCSSTSGNFGLCENIDTSTNRKSIINRTACWDEVKDCIRSAGAESINDIITKHLNVATDNSSLNFYDSMYENAQSAQIIQGEQNQLNGTCAITNNSNCIYDMCYEDCKGSDVFTCRTCRLAEKIWGNCEVSPKTPLAAQMTHNKIKEPIDKTTPTLLYWFALNTGTEYAYDSCRDTTCGVGYTSTWNDATNSYVCVRAAAQCFESYTSSRQKQCDTDNGEREFAMNESCFCCTAFDTAGNCCDNGKTVTYDDGTHQHTFCTYSPDDSSNTSEFITTQFTGTDGMDHILMCAGGTVQNTNNTVDCSGTLVDIRIKTSNDQTHYYYMSPATESTNTYYVENVFRDSDNYEWRYQCANDNTNCAFVNSNYDRPYGWDVPAWAVVFRAQ